MFSEPKSGYLPSVQERCGLVARRRRITVRSIDRDSALGHGQGATDGVKGASGKGPLSAKCDAVELGRHGSWRICDDRWRSETGRDVNDASLGGECVRRVGNEGVKRGN
jgi:hypothetical protein